jgi:hypothetical protein
MSIASDVSQAPVQALRLGSKGEPTLLLSTTSEYSWLYNDIGAGAERNVQIWRPRPPDGTWRILGDYAQGNYSSPTGAATIIKPINDDWHSPLIKIPDTYAEVWRDQGSGGDHDGSIWFPVAPPGYISVGFMAQPGYGPPDNMALYACLRSDLLEKTDVGAMIWNDAGSGAHQDVALYTVLGLANAFVAQADYNPWTGTAYRLKQQA